MMTDRNADDALLLTPTEVASLLKVSRRHVDRLAGRGAMPAPVRLGTRVRFLRAEIESWIASGCPEMEKGTD